MPPSNVRFTAALQDAEQALTDDLAGAVAYALDLTGEQIDDIAARHAPGGHEVAALCGASETSAPVPRRARRNFAACS